MSRAYFVSDIHLKTMEERNSQTLLRFFISLQEPERKPTDLFLVGDIFDLWVGGHAYFINRFRPLVDELGKLIAAGVTVHFFEGNHDLYLHNYWQGELGARVYEDSADFILDGRRVRVEHGDLINLEDTTYIVWRRFLRTSFMRVLALNAPDSWVGAVGEWLSRESRKRGTHRQDTSEHIRKLIRQHAVRELEAGAEFDLLVTGHVHVVDDAWIEARGHRARSVNLGSWFDGPKIFFLEGERAEFLDLGFLD
jgi:UDP-2,3-diacylglucosamine hydrolase